MSKHFKDLSSTFGDKANNAAETKFRFRANTGDLNIKSAEPKPLRNPGGGSGSGQTGGNTSGVSQGGSQQQGGGQTTQTPQPQKQSSADYTRHSK